MTDAKHLLSCVCMSLLCTDVFDDKAIHVHASCCYALQLTMIHYHSGQCLMVALLSRTMPHTLSYTHTVYMYYCTDDKHMCVSCSPTIHTSCSSYFHMHADQYRQTYLYIVLFDSKQLCMSFAEAVAARRNTEASGRGVRAPFTQHDSYLCKTGSMK